MQPKYELPSLWRSVYLPLLVAGLSTDRRTPQAREFYYPKGASMIAVCRSCKNEVEVFAEPEFFICAKCRDIDFSHRGNSGYDNHPTKRIKATIPASIRWAVWERDDFTCQHCGSRKHLTVDHIHPESKGGLMTMDNAQTLCRSCNSRKGAR